MAWTQPGFDDSRWQEREEGIWNVMDPALADYRGTMLYRFAFTPQPGWKGHRVVLGLYSFDRPIVYDDGIFYVNGHRVTEYKARGGNQTLQFDVTDYLQPGKNVLAIRTAGTGSFRGLNGAVWLAPEANLAPSESLAGTWTSIASDGVSDTPVSVPGRVQGHFLRRDVVIPAAWQGRQVWLHVETPTQWLSCISVNGHLICYHFNMHPFGLRTDVNLTPYLKPGQVNRLELWPFECLPKGTSGTGANKTWMEVQATRIGCLAE